MSRKFINIPKKKSARRNVRSSTKPDLSHNNFTFDFRDNRWLSGIKVGRFTNKLKDIDSYSRFITLILGRVIPEVQEKSEDIMKSAAVGFHCHAIEQGERSYNTIIEVMREIYGTRFEGSIDDNEQIYQLGVVGSVRIITLRNKNTNVIRPLFIDYHHLAYPSVKYNQTDYLSQEFCPRNHYL